MALRLGLWTTKYVCYKILMCILMFLCNFMVICMIGSDSIVSTSWAYLGSYTYVRIKFGFFPILECKCADARFFLLTRAQGISNKSAWKSSKWLPWRRTAEQAFSCSKLPPRIEWTSLGKLNDERHQPVSICRWRSGHSFTSKRKTGANEGGWKKKQPEPRPIGF